MSKKYQKDNQTIIDGYDYLGNSASATDCTGLIPSAPLSKAERDSYQDVYHYQPKASSVSSRGPEVSGKIRKKEDA